MKELTWLDDLKLRASWGQTGNQEISNLARYTIYAPNYGTTDSFGGQSYGTAYDITGSNGGSTLPSGFKRNQIGMIISSGRQPHRPMSVSTSACSNNPSMVHWNTIIRKQPTS